MTMDQGLKVSNTSLPLPSTCTRPAEVRLEFSTAMSVANGLPGIMLYRFPRRGDAATD